MGSFLTKSVKTGKGRRKNLLLLWQNWSQEILGKRFPIMEAGWRWNYLVQSMKRWSSPLQPRMATRLGNIKHSKFNLIEVKDTCSTSEIIEKFSELYGQSESCHSGKFHNRLNANLFQTLRETTFKMNFPQILISPTPSSNWRNSLVTLTQS